MYLGRDLADSDVLVHRKVVRLDVGGRKRLFVDPDPVAFARMARSDLLDTSDVCRVFPCARRSLYRWMAERRLQPRVKLGREFFFTKAEVLRWWRERPQLGRPLAPD